MVSEKSQNESLPVPDGRFAATHWSVVLAAASEDSQEAATTEPRLFYRAMRVP